MKIITSTLLNEVIRTRPTHSHKGTYGRVCLIGGNKQYGGAIILASLAAVHSGAGLVTTITKKENHASLHSHLPEAMCLSWEDIDHQYPVIEKATTIVIGPGLGLEDNSLSLLLTTLTLLQPKQICIIDGSAITLIAKHNIELPNGPLYIFTPHEREWQRLSRLSIANQTLKNNQQACRNLNGIVVLKKHRTEIYTNEQVWQNPLGTAAMATGGMGDTLAGMIAGFTAQFENKVKATLAAVYLHSYIGEELGKSKYIVLPSEIITQISTAMKQFESN